LVVEDDPWVQGSVLAALATDDRITPLACGTVADALRAIDEGAACDVALVDLGLPDGSGLDVLRRLARERPDAASVAFTVFDDEETVLGALRAGARGYLLKSTPVAELPGLLREAQGGGAPMTPVVARLVLDALVPAPRPGDEGPLSPREREVLRLLARGHTYAAAGHALGIGLGTVQGHVKSIYQKLQVASKAEAALAAARLGLT
jgi:DNA-binding NarL/FixJ family response regulator